MLVWKLIDGKRMKAATRKQHEEVIDDKSSVDQAVHVLVTPADPL